MISSRKPVVVVGQQLRVRRGDDTGHVRRPESEPEQAPALLRGKQFGRKTGLVEQTPEGVAGVRVIGRRFMRLIPDGRADEGGGQSRREQTYRNPNLATVVAKSPDPLLFGNDRAAIRSTAADPNDTQSSQH